MFTKTKHVQIQIRSEFKAATNSAGRVSVTHISGWLLQILVIHMSRDDLCGQRSRSKRLRKLPFKLRLNEVQLPAGNKMVK